MAQRLQHADGAEQAGAVVAQWYGAGQHRRFAQPDGDTVALQAQGPDGAAGLLATATLG